MDIREMKAGRDLDELIMAKVMGWKKEADHKPLPMWRDNNGFNVDHIARFFTPSVDISAAWEVEEKMCEAGYFIRLADQEKFFRARFYDPKFLPVEKPSWVKAETAPEAICKAALLAMEGAK